MARTTSPKNLTAEQYKTAIAEGRGELGRMTVSLSAHKPHERRALRRTIARNLTALRALDKNAQTV